MGKTCRTIDVLDTESMNSIEVVKSFYKILASDGLAALELLEASAQWTEMFPGYAGTSIGPEAIRQNLFEPLGRDWDTFAVTPDFFVTDGSVVVAFGTYTGTYKATGKSLSAPFVHRWEVIDGRVTRFRQYTDTALIGKALT
jgi:ketosteroid isomerase-like protein